MRLGWNSRTVAWMRLTRPALWSSPQTRWLFGMRTGLPSNQWNCLPDPMRGVAREAGELLHSVLEAAENQRLFELTMLDWAESKRVEWQG
jgi:hypothetical protein